MRQSTPELQTYNLPDSDFLESTTSLSAVWCPNKTMIVLGQSNRIAESVNIRNALKDSIPIVQRNSGGEAVVLSPKTLVISLAIKERKLQTPFRWFNHFNQIIVHTLKQLGITNVKTRGISDLAIDGRKILGSSIYRKNGRLLFHAVLNINEDPKLIDRYLKHPQKEPDYRAQRNHKEFVTSLWREGFKIDSSILLKELEKKIKEALQAIG